MESEEEENKKWGRRKVWEKKKGKAIKDDEIE